MSQASSRPPQPATDPAAATSSTESKICGSCNPEEMKTPNHRAELRRIKRIAGQLSGVERMILEGRYCPDILMQTRAVSAAIRSLETALLERHIKHCVQGAFLSDDLDEREAKTAELIEIFAKRLER